MKMQLTYPPHTARRRAQAGFSLAEVAVGMGLLATLMGALFSSFTSGFFTIQMARENLRATQILLEKVETIRLYSWSQMNTPGFIPATFTAAYDPNSTNSGLIYRGTMTITNAPITGSYANDVKQFTVRIDWNSGSLPRTREFTTFVARNGLQNYIY
ncbi:MAG: prepilin-type N-terminal cleavage/methylation domain-containing protein [Verrucomicrobia bacterium]|nr:prepilin-type N-terminal cleavage/methylation domain-containing protein [Verrucomicrobiota bacterium]